MESAKSVFSGESPPRASRHWRMTRASCISPWRDDVGGPLGAVYVRNSGTESRTGVVLRGPLEWQEKLCAVGDEVLREISKAHEG